MPKDASPTPAADEKTAPKDPKTESTRVYSPPDPPNPDDRDAKQMRPTAGATIEGLGEVSNVPKDPEPEVCPAQPDPEDPNRAEMEDLAKWLPPGLFGKKGLIVEYLQKHGVEQKHRARLSGGYTSFERQMYDRYSKWQKGRRVHKEHFVAAFRMCHARDQYGRVVYPYGPEPVLDLTRWAIHGPDDD